MEEERPKSITRRDLPSVVRRAAELADVDNDIGDALSEQEVIRIAAELGLSERHVRQAMYEGAREEAEPSLLDRQLGTPRIAATRAVPFDAARARQSVEAYLVTCEYLAVVRHQGASTTFHPAPDTMSKIARKFKRNSNHLLASSEAVELTVQPLENGWSHVRLRIVFEDKRRASVVRSIVGGVLIGIPAGTLAGVLVGGIAAGVAGAFTTDIIGQQIAIGLGTLTGLAAFWGVIAGSMASMRGRYRRWRDQATTQAEGVLDRVESGDDLRPAPAPWVRNIREKLGL